MTWYAWSRMTIARESRVIPGSFLVTRWAWAAWLLPPRTGVWSSISARTVARRFIPGREKGFPGPDATVTLCLQLIIRLRGIAPPIVHPQIDSLVPLTEISPGPGIPGTDLPVEQEFRAK